MLYQYVKDIDVTDKFEYIIIVAAVILLATRIGYHGLISSSGLFGLVIGVIITFYLIEKRKHQGDTFITAMRKILNSDIMKPNWNKYIHGNSELIIFLNDHREYYQYNPQLWRDMVSSMNNFQRTISDIEIGTTRYNLDYDQLKETKKKILNRYQAFIHTMPHTENSNNKFHKGSDRLEQLLNQEIDHIHQLVTRKNAKNITTASTFHYKNHPVSHESLNVAENTYTFFNQ